MKGEVLDGRALVMTARDTVATALSDLEAEDSLPVDGERLRLREAVPFGHKLALKPIERGAEIYKYGEVIGRATEPIAPGEWVHTHNAESTRGRGDRTEAESRSDGGPSGGERA